MKRTVYFGMPAYLSVRNRQMVVGLPQVEKSDMHEGLKKEAERTLPIEDVGIVILDNTQITITQGLLEALMENNSAVVTCDERRIPQGLMLPMEGHTLQSVRYRKQLSASQPLKKQLWQQTVRAKIMNQKTVLDQQTRDDHKCMAVWAEEVRSGDTDNVEARAAAYYWRRIFPSIADFVRKRDGVFPNNLLNYGYAIVRAMVARAIVGTGLLPTIGLFHHNQYNAYCLADDIMEPYRPWVDKMVCQLLPTLDAEGEMTKATKTALLSLPTEDVWIDGHRSPMQIAIETTVDSLFDCFDETRRKIIYPEMSA